ncbi:hypothetical protein BDY19DRAFT_1080534 [Irpex rosettiformis]|uniref:Uncharacterized protein n=1 Tax=Irpex rosettiformis TaxID=378272 RepID=A0ACB8UKB1_9APHY|nr:hypothetical protein BDY19DRAFT_1080534 [Irpex rosettiformis]
MTSTRTATATPPAGPAVVTQTAGPAQVNPLLAAYLTQLAAHPLRTKQVTSGIFSFLTEIIANHLAGVPSRKVPRDAPTYEHVLAAAKIESKAFKMSLYGFFVSAPLSHVLVGKLQQVFAGKTDVKSKVLQILASNLLISPILISAYLASAAIINGARSVNSVLAVVKGGLFQALKVSWVTSPLSIAIAQNYLSPEVRNSYFCSSLLT